MSHREMENTEDY